MKRVLDYAVNISPFVAVAATLVMMLHVTLDVALRNLFNAPLTGTLEVAAHYNMAMLSFLPLALIAREKGHIIVELFTGWMKPSRRKVLDGLIAIVTTVYVAVFAWEVFEDKTRIRDAKEAGFGFLEVWPARWFVFVGFALMLVYAVYYMIDDLKTGFGGKAKLRPDDGHHIPTSEENL
jgi:TRAP-type C4-dicarboxylate transport system permease small subunit